MSTKIRTRKAAPQHIRAGVRFGPRWTEHELTDEQLALIEADPHLEVQQVKAQKSAKKAAEKAAEKPPALVNVNTATAKQIAKAANGIGEKTANDLVKWRASKGPFESLADLTKVGGIGDATVAENEAVLTV